MNSQIFWYILLIAFVIRTLRNGFYQTFLWQLKEYRFDRLLLHLKTGQGKKLILGPLALLKWMPLAIYSGILVLSYFNLLSASDNWTDLIALVYYFFWSIWTLEAMLNIKELFTRGWKIPQFTLKIILILISVFIFQFATVLINIQAPLILGPILDKFLPLSIFLFIMLFNIPSFILKQIIIKLAKRKIAKFPKLTVIGITGSYGKTSTKEFLATILSERFKVAKTPEFTNTDIGIAKYILKELNSKDDVFVVEMGAYLKGEIKAICDMVKPKMGIITGINQQHLELFGSIENTMKAKFELIESLPEDGIAIFNGNNDYCLQMAKWAEKLRLKIFTFNSAKDVKNVKIFVDHIEFTQVDKKDRFKINLLGSQAIENVLAAMYAAKNLRVTADEIKKGISKIVPPTKTMQFVGKIKGMTLVDDTFNANPAGVLAGVEYMNTFKGKKILVLTPLIELGEEAEKIHEKLGSAIAKICDLIALTNLNFSKSFISGTHKVSKETKTQIVNSTVGTKLIRDNLDKGGIVMFEGKEAGKILDRLLYV